MNNRQRRSRMTRFGSAAACFSIITAKVEGTATTWNNSGTDFNTDSDWNNKAPKTGSVAVFNTTEASKPNISAPLTISSLEFKPNADGYDLAGSALTLTATAVSGNSGTSDSSAPAISDYNAAGTNIIDVALTLSPTSGGIATFYEVTGGTLVVNGVVSSSAGTNLSLKGGGEIDLNNSNSFSTASIDTSNELVVLGNNTALGSGQFSINQTSTIQAGGGAHSIANTVTLGADITIGGANNLTFSNVLTETGGSRSISVSNTANTIFTAANTYTGNTNVNAGATLLANGTMGSATGTSTVTVLSGRIGGNGTIAGTVNVGSTDGTTPGVISPGAAGAVATTGSIGVLTITGGTSLRPKGTFEMELSANANGSVGASDLLDIVGLTLSGLSSSNQFNISVLRVGANPSVPLVTGTQFAILKTTSSFSNTTLANDFNIANDSAGDSYKITEITDNSYDGGGFDIVLTATDTSPEPTSVILFGSAVMPLLLNRRRRKVDAESAAELSPAAI